MTVTSSGEFTTWKLFTGNGWPGLIPGWVGPNPVVSRMTVSPARAGAASVTREKSEWKMAGPVGVIRISGRDSVDQMVDEVNFASTGVTPSCWILTN